MATRLLVIAAGGALGALARYAVSEWFVRRLPAGTLLVNVVGCFLIGLAMGLSIEHRWMSPNVRLFFVTGFLGALTTFSTFGWQTFSLAEKKDFTLALANIGLNVVGSLVAVAIGFQLAVMVNPRGR
ncbi:MAG TPA: fluoride efflux transporter CrcB [Caulifigura sp.]|nr:fluoride efflux transporter CrcB [Caulifigura sp.]